MCKRAKELRFFVLKKFFKDKEQREENDVSYRNSACYDLLCTIDRSIAQTASRIARRKWNPNSFNSVTSYNFLVIDEEAEKINCS